MLDIYRCNITLDMARHNIDGAAVGQFIDDGAESSANRVEAKVADLRIGTQFVEPVSQRVAVIRHKPSAIAIIEEIPAFIGLESLQCGDRFWPQWDDALSASLVPVVVEQVALDHLPLDAGYVGVSQPAIDGEIDRGGKHRLSTACHLSQFDGGIEPSRSGCRGDAFLFAGGLHEHRAVSDGPKPTLTDGKVEQASNTHNKLLTPIDGLIAEGGGERGEVLGSDCINQSVLPDESHEGGEDLPIVTHRPDCNPGRLCVLEGITDVGEGNRVSALAWRGKVGELEAEYLVGFGSSWGAPIGTDVPGDSGDAAIPSALSSGEAVATDASVRISVRHFSISSDNQAIMQRLLSPSRLPVTTRRAPGESLGKIRSFSGNSRGSSPTLAPAGNPSNSFGLSNAALELVRSDCESPSPGAIA